MRDRGTGIGVGGRAREKVKQIMREQRWQKKD